MNCQSWLELLPQEKEQLICKLIHAVQNDEHAFGCAKAIVNTFDFTGVKFNQETCQKKT